MNPKPPKPKRGKKPKASEELQKPAAVLNWAQAASASMRSEGEKQRRESLLLPILPGLDPTVPIEFDRKYGPEHNDPQRAARPAHIESGLRTHHSALLVSYRGKLPDLPGPVEPAQIYGPLKPDFEKDIRLPSVRLSNAQIYDSREPRTLSDTVPALETASGYMLLQKTPAPDISHLPLAGAYGSSLSKKTLAIHNARSDGANSHESSPSSTQSQNSFVNPSSLLLPAPQKPLLAAHSTESLLAVPFSCRAQLLPKPASTNQLSSNKGKKRTTENDELEYFEVAAPRSMQYSPSPLKRWKGKRKDLS